MNQPDTVIRTADERIVHSEGKDRWGLWIAKRGRVKGVAVLHYASDMALEFHCAMRDDDKRAYLGRLLKVLNAAQEAGKL